MSSCQGATVLTYEGCGNKVFVPDVLCEDCQILEEETELDEEWDRVTAKFERRNAISHEKFECHVDWSESDDSYYYDCLTGRFQ